MSASRCPLRFSISRMTLTLQLSFIPSPVGTYQKKRPRFWKLSDWSYSSFSFPWKPPTLNFPYFWWLIRGMLPCLVTGTPSQGSGRCRHHHADPNLHSRKRARALGASYQWWKPNGKKLEVEGQSSGLERYGKAEGWGRAGIVGTCLSWSLLWIQESVWLTLFSLSLSLSLSSESCHLWTYPTPLNWQH
jgi:hypothetical protein